MGRNGNWWQIKTTAFAPEKKRGGILKFKIQSKDEHRYLYRLTTKRKSPGGDSLRHLAASVKQLYWSGGLSHSKTTHIPRAPASTERCTQKCTARTCTQPPSQALLLTNHTERINSWTSLWFDSCTLRLSRSPVSVCLPRLRSSWELPLSKAHRITKKGTLADLNNGISLVFNCFLYFSAHFKKKAIFLFQLGWQVCWLSEFFQVYCVLLPQQSLCASSFLPSSSARSQSFSAITF